MVCIHMCAYVCLCVMYVWYMYSKPLTMVNFPKGNTLEIIPALRISLTIEF